MAEANEIATLSVNGRNYGGWKSVSIGAGIERCSRDFNLSVTWKWPGQSTAIGIHQGDRAEVRIGNDLVLTGWVYATPIRHDASAIELSVSGRSITSDLVDCAADNKPGQWRNQTVAQIVSALVAPYGITVIDQTGDSGTLADHTIQPGETIFESIDRLLTLSHLFATDDGRGRLIIANPGSAGRAVDRLVVGENVLSGDAPLDFSGVFSEYKCKGQHVGSDDAFGADTSEVSASVTDARVRRKRVKVIQESGNITASIAQGRVQWERDNRISKALATTYGVQGWRQSNGRLWIPNQTVRVVDPIIGFDRDMLIVEATYVKGEQGTTTTMKVAPPDGYMPEPDDPHKRRKLKKGKKGDNFEYLLPADWEKN
ncbi:phage baseplate assembly protein [Burkholderia vietnamiensis]|uniref:phage baseplate assembly protein n=1 Tax=Burkholderia vietnamiensis TaxID=60552 RepID=UPI000841CC54|nr:contractile injection system protein, VgrG/Pvc8 family [Burkholderia vietnamiensis]AOK40844.1 baseplate protein [Burkholderia vietnamiensis]